MPLKSDPTASTCNTEVVSKDKRTHCLRFARGCKLAASDDRAAQLMAGGNPLTATNFTVDDIIRKFSNALLQMCDIEQHEEGALSANRVSSEQMINFQTRHK